MSSQPAEPAPKTKPPGCRKRNNPNDQGYRHDLYPQEKEAQRQIALCFDRAGEYPLPPPETPKRDFKEKTMPLIVEDGTLPAGATNILRSSAPSSVRTGMFWRLGSVEESRPVAVTVF